MSPVWIPAVAVAGVVLTTGLLASQVQAALLPAPTAIDERIRIVRYESVEQDPLAASRLKLLT